MRNHFAIAGAVEIVVINVDGFYGVNHSFTTEVTPQFFLLGVDTDHWLGSI